MSKIEAIKYVVGGSVVGGLAATVIYLSGCATRHIKGDGTETTIPNPASLVLSEDPDKAIKQKHTIGSQMTGVLRKDGEFDDVGYYLHNFGYGLNLVIRGSMENDYGKLTKWAVNLDCVCRAMMREKKFLLLDLSDKVLTEMCNANVVMSPSFAHRVAQQLTEALSLYTGNNKERCESLLNDYQEKSGPKYFVE